MPPIVDVYRARIPSGDVDRLLAVREEAVTELQERVPELLRAELVRLADDVWLDIVVWKEPVEMQLVMDVSEQIPACVEMHRLASDIVGSDRGELVHTVGGV